MEHSKLPAIIIDLDGTLCDTAHRQHFMQAPKKDWPAFYDALERDPPNRWCLKLVQSMSGAFRIIFVSGRPDDYLAQTMKWLNSHPEIYGMHHEVLMRKGGDFRKDSIVKEEIYRQHIEPKYNVLFCVDDRKQVVDMWRRIGLTCLQCAEGNF